MVQSASISTSRRSSGAGLLLRELPMAYRCGLGSAGPRHLRALRDVDLGGRGFLESLSCLLLSVRKSCLVLVYKAIAGLKSAWCTIEAMKSLFSRNDLPFTKHLAAWKMQFNLPNLQPTASCKSLIRSMRARTLYMRSLQKPAAV